MASEEENIEIIEQINFVKKERKYYRSKATRACNYIHNNQNNIDPQEQLSLQRDLVDLKDKLNSSNEKLSKLQWRTLKSDEDIEAELESCDSYDGKLSDAIRVLASLTGKIENINKYLKS